MRLSPRHILILLLALPLFACRTATTHLPHPQAIQASGIFVQNPSGMKFPDGVDGFHRVSITRYDRDGLDVSVGYDLSDPRTPVVATVYVYPSASLFSLGSPADVVADAREHLCQSEFARNKAQIVRRHPDALLVKNGKYDLSRKSVSVSGETAEYEFDALFGETRLRVSSELYLFCYVSGKWTIEYRFTSPRDAPSSDRITTFMKDLPSTISDQSG